MRRASKPIMDRPPENSMAMTAAFQGSYFRSGSWLADFFDRFPFRLQPIFEVVSNQSATVAMDLVSAVQDFLNVQAFADCIFADDSVFQFNSLCDFGMQTHDEVTSLRRAPPRRFLHTVFLQWNVSMAGGAALQSSQALPPSSVLDLLEMEHESGGRFRGMGGYVRAESGDSEVRAVVDKSAIFQS